MLGFCYNAVRSNAQQASSIDYMKAGLLKQTRGNWINGSKLRWCNSAETEIVATFWQHIFTKKMLCYSRITSTMFVKLQRHFWWGYDQPLTTPAHL